MRPLHRSRRFDADLRACVDFYAAEAPHMVGRLLHTVEAATRHISRYPGIGSLRYASLTGLMELRSIAVRRFPYVILYIDREDRIDLIRLLHLKRDIPRSLPNDE